MSHLRRLSSLLPVLAMLFALAGIAGARAGAERMASPELSALCLGGEQPAASHDCQACCLPKLTGVPQAAHVQRPGTLLAGLLLPEPVGFGLGGFSLASPLSRGPPALA